ncbi:hypothetical protein T07_5614 [Trichinella nelsoni]|uniref:Uncharacterized protein n=1 Tax=Trichinella nelsoni TaxID=6336 RepID=A0A0V0SBG3_9BILA|nr:hypothetical protein T07_5614 [Trichinella nelsoni]
MKLFSPDISDEDIEGHQGLMNMFYIVNDYLLNLLLDILIRKYIIANLHLHIIPNSSKFAVDVLICDDSVKYAMAFRFKTSTKGVSN